MNALQAMRADRLLTRLALLPLLPRLVGLSRRRPGVRPRNSASEATASLPLAHTALRWVQRPCGLVVTCEAGALWLTFDGEEHDIVLEAGQSHRCESDSRLAIYALAAAQLHLRPAPVLR